MLRFEVRHKDSNSQARCGIIHTAHGPIDTPAFMPVGTRGTVKGLTPDQIKKTHTQILLANTYHLWQRPGPERIARLGGLHAFMGWDSAILTDSGGYQLYSLADLVKITDDGAEFKSHIDGQRLFLNAPQATTIQQQLGADIIMAFDQCTRYPCTREEVEVAVGRTTKWARLCRDCHRDSGQALFGIIQGGIYEDLRTHSMSALGEMDFCGYAVGGLSVGEPHSAMIEVLELLSGLMPQDKPRYLMGVGMPADILQAVQQGIDMFDCVLPTRNGRNAYAFTAHAPLRLRNEQYKDDGMPIEPGCDCYCCTHFSRSYIRHLFNVEEMLGAILTSLHNIRFYQRFMNHIREGIRQDQLRRIVEEYPVADSSV